MVKENLYIKKVKYKLNDKNEILMTFDKFFHNFIFYGSTICFLLSLFFLNYYLAIPIIYYITVYLMSFFLTIMSKRKIYYVKKRMRGKND